MSTILNITLSTNLVKMFKSYCEVQYRFWYNYYKENFNYIFGGPRTDICTVCAEHEANIKLEKNVAAKRTQNVKLELHKKASVLQVAKTNCTGHKT